MSESNVIPIIAEPTPYVPPSLEQTGSKPISELRDRHKGETCYIVGKAPSLANLKAQHFGPGPVLVLNEAIHYVQTFGLPNQIYSMQKDGCVTSDPFNIPRPCSTCAQLGWKRDPVIDPYPGIAVLFSQYLSSWCLHGRQNRYVFTDEELGYGQAPLTMSVLESIPLALHLGAKHLVMMCFDSYFVQAETASLNHLSATMFELDPASAKNTAWAKPHVLRALSTVSHSFFIPN